MDQAKNNSWVRNRLHVSLCKKPLSFTVGSEPSCFFYTDEKDIKVALEAAIDNSNTKIFSEEQLNIYSNWLSWIIFCNGMEYDWNAYEACDYNERNYHANREDVTISLLPIKIDSFGLSYGKKDSNYTFLFSIDIPRFLDKQNNDVSGSAPLGGFYSYADDLIVIDSSGLDHLSISGFHECIHTIVRHYKDKVMLRDHMYGENEAAQTEEIMTHFISDNFHLVSGLYNWFNKSMFNRDEDGRIISLSLPHIQLNYGDLSDGSADECLIDLKKSTVSKTLNSIKTNQSRSKSKKEQLLQLAKYSRYIAGEKLSNNKVLSMLSKLFPTMDEASLNNLIVNIQKHSQGR